MTLFMVICVARPDTCRAHHKAALRLQLNPDRRADARIPTGSKNRIKPSVIAHRKRCGLITRRTEPPVAIHPIFERFLIPRQDVGCRLRNPRRIGSIQVSCREIAFRFLIAQQEHIVFRIVSVLLMIWIWTSLLHAVVDLALDDALFLRGAEGVIVKGPIEQGAQDPRIAIRPQTESFFGRAYKTVPEGTGLPRLQGCSSLPQVQSMANAPNGAVSRIASTETMSTHCPQGRPMASGSPPIAACTVALGV